MTVKELIEFLKPFPPDLQVAYRIHSEQALLEASDITTYAGCVARPDGWIQDARPDMPKQMYLLFPGN